MEQQRRDDREAREHEGGEARLEADKHHQAEAEFGEDDQRQKQAGHARALHELLGAAAGEPHELGRAGHDVHGGEHDAPGKEREILDGRIVEHEFPSDRCH